MQGSSISAVRIERTAHPVSTGRVSAGQRHCVVRDRIELSTFRFSGAFLPSRGVACGRPISHLTCPIVAGRRLASLGVCRRWLPLWLPVWLPELAGGESTAESQNRSSLLQKCSPADSAILNFMARSPYSGSCSRSARKPGTAIHGEAKRAQWLAIRKLRG